MHACQSPLPAFSSALNASSFLFTPPILLPSQVPTLAFISAYFHMCLDCHARAYMMAVMHVHMSWLPLYITLATNKLR